ncbi:MAG TPA: amidase domain-containing protein, partial [Clostridia bacterium]|nr:amidase domain-containing protein [Clostridia bacterium]
MKEIYAYNREKAVLYARRWAFGRNPEYYDFTTLGGDCTNFASQVLYAGTGVMNYQPVTGWYYVNVNSRTASWTGVPFFYSFVTSNQGAGPFGKVVGLEDIQPGDFIQLNFDGERYAHTPVVVSVG